MRKQKPIRVSADGRAICGAKSPNSKSGTGLCHAPPMANGRCKLHGGMTPGGIASPHFVHGRSSRYMPTRLLERYQAALKDPELLSLRRDLALLEARLDELLKLLEQGKGTLESLELMSRYRREAKSALTDHPTSPSKALAAINDTLATLALLFEERDTWNQIHGLLEQRRKLAETEHKHVTASQEMLSPEQVMALVASLGMAVKKHISDEVTLRAISTELAGIIHAGAVRELVPAAEAAS